VYSIPAVTEGPVTAAERDDTELDTDLTKKEDVDQGAIDLVGQPSTTGKIDIDGKTYCNLGEDVCYVNQ